MAWDSASLRLTDMKGPIGIFDSGYGGLTVFKEIEKQLPEFDYIYLGDNARTPYGTRSLEKVYEFTLEGVRYLFEQGCNLVILACNTASANALRTIQRKNLASFGPQKRVLGVIRPTTERLSEFSHSGHIGLCGTTATVNSGSYVIEAQKYAPDIQVHQQACPLWVPMVENDEIGSEAAHLITQKYLSELLGQHPDIDAVLLACTHYPLMYATIKAHLPEGITLISQGELVAHSLRDYLSRHPEMEALCSKGGSRIFLTTDSPESFDRLGENYYSAPVHSQRADIEAKKNPHRSGEDLN
jgi:glutamate racemase